jgi:hypothetical protein
MDVPVQLQTVDDGRMFAIKGLLDSGCTGSAINQKFVGKHGMYLNEEGGSTHPNL